MPPNDKVSGISHSNGEQLSLFDDLPQDAVEKKTASKKPSILGGVAAAKEAIAKAEKQAADTSKKREEESL
jgi:hypothetical protein